MDVDGEEKELMRYLMKINEKKSIETTREKRCFLDTLFVDKEIVSRFHLVIWL